MLNEINFYFNNLFSSYAFAVKIFLTILVTGLINFIVSKYIIKTINFLKSTKLIYDDIFFEALDLPLKIFIWFLGLYFSLYLLELNISLMPKIKSIVFIAIFMWIILRFITKLEKRLEEKISNGEIRLNKTTLLALSKLIKTALIITTSLIALQIFGVPISGVLAFGGIGGIGVAFAAKDLLANFFGGLMIYLDRPFEVGDWIRSPDKDIEGVVEHIGWRLTSIRTFDQRLRYVPNNLFSVITIDNPSRMRNRRIKTVIGLRYADANKIDEIIKSIKAMLIAHDDIDKKRVLLVNLIEFGPSSLNFQVYTFTKTVDWAQYLNIQQDVFLKILSIIAEYNAKCAFPTRTLHINPDADN
jgi:MscS family membrane protein